MRAVALTQFDEKPIPFFLESRITKVRDPAGFLPARNELCMGGCLFPEPVRVVSSGGATNHPQHNQLIVFFRDLQDSVNRSPFGI